MEHAGITLFYNQYCLHILYNYSLQDRYLPKAKVKIFMNPDLGSTGIQDFLIVFNILYFHRICVEHNIGLVLGLILWERYCLMTRVLG